jgi:hypothetical protein
LFRDIRFFAACFRAPRYVLPAESKRPCLYGVANSYSGAPSPIYDKFNWRFDVSAAANYTTLDGGLASVSLNNNQITVATGMRQKF